MPHALAAFFASASADIAGRRTPDPSPVVEAIELPTGVSQYEAALRLAKMADYAQEAARSQSKQAARLAYAKLYGPEVEAIREREARSVDRQVAMGASLAPLVSAFHKPTRSDGV